MKEKHSHLGESSNKLFLLCKQKNKHFDAINSLNFGDKTEAGKLVNKCVFFFGQTNKTKQD